MKNVKNQGKSRVLTPSFLKICDCKTRPSENLHPRYQGSVSNLRLILRGCPEWLSDLEGQRVTDSKCIFVTLDTYITTFLSWILLYDRKNYNQSLDRRTDDDGWTADGQTYAEVEIVIKIYKSSLKIKVWDNHVM